MKLKDNETRLGQGEILAVIYSDLFDYPLTREEASYWAIQSPLKLSGRLGDSVRCLKNYYFLAGREQVIKNRLARERYSVQKWRRAREVAAYLKRIPLVAGVFLTGSAAVKNAGREADIDLMIVTVPGTLWLTRLLVVLALKARGIYPGKGGVKDKICPNIFLSANNLAVSDRNLYTAHEVAQAVCLYDAGSVRDNWLLVNNWVGKFLPNSLAPARPGVSGRQVIFSLLFPLELLAFVSQYLYMWPKRTREKISLNSAYLHPRDLSASIPRQFLKRVEKLRYNVSDE